MHQRLRARGATRDVHIDRYDFVDALSWDAIIGTSGGEGGCTVDYAGMLGCNGDPSVPGVGGITLKFEPMEDAGCEPGTSGRVLYSEDMTAP